MIRTRTILALIFVTALCGIAVAQNVGPDTVFVTVTVTGPKKAPAPGLKAENFQIAEDGVEQKIIAFSGADGPWDINLLLANSQLLPGRADRTSAAIRDAVETFQKSSNPMSKIKIEELHFGSDGLFAAIDRNLVDLQKTTNPRRALIVINDDFDKPGGDAGQGLVEYSRKLNIPIYFLYTRTISQDPATPTGARGANYSLPEGEALTMVAEQTGGAIYFVDALHQLESQCKLLAEELRAKYVLGFNSTNDKKDDKWRKLKLKFTPPAGPKLAADMKGKYFVPKPLPPK
jgi:Ca-activated chloride channel family protein